MKRGTITILIILVVAVGAAGVSLIYHYRNQHRAQELWGTTTALLIDKAPRVEVLQLGEPGQRIRDDEDDIDASEAEGSDPEGPPLPKAVEFADVPWVIVASRDAATAKGIANLRRALVLDTSFDWVPGSVEPEWQYGLAVDDGRDWATVLFDFDSRQVGLAGGRKTAVLNAEANDEFRAFFVEQFSTDGPVDTPAADETQPREEQGQVEESPRDEAND